MRYIAYKLYSLSFIIKFVQIIISIAVFILVFIFGSHFYQFLVNSESLFGFSGNEQMFFKIVISLFGTFIILKQIQHAVFSTRISERRLWKDDLRKGLSIMRKDNPYFYDIIDRYADHIFDFLYLSDIEIKDKLHLKIFFKKFIKPNVKDFEQNSIKYEDAEGFYTSTYQSYSIEHFDYIYKVLLRPNLKYLDNIYIDFRKMYLEEVNKFSSFKIRN